MAPPHGREDASVIAQLADEAYRFDFFQAVRILEREAFRQARAEQSPPREPVGYDGPPHKEVVRFRAHQSHSFPAGEISELELPDGKDAEQSPQVPELTVACLGLTGPSGVLPHHYTTLLMERIREKDESMRDFFDLFNHRALSLFYRAWEKYRLPQRYERHRQTARRDRPDLFAQMLYCFVGLGTGGLRDRLQLDDDAFLYFGGYFSRDVRSAVALKCLLHDYLGLPVEIEQFTGQWLYLSDDDQSQMPTRVQPQGLNCELGANVIIGERVWSVENKFRVRLGPLTYRDFLKFLPGADGLRIVGQLVRQYVGPEFDFDIQVVLLPQEAPWCQLGGDGAQLGWNTWVRSGEFVHEVDDAVVMHDGRVS